ncbi:hypothetical protein K466DRAFT_666604 [Polyporus arcularius HHB13444]|uniref:Uncharacterized protein n=1 Tax=Polyporus arcularius HHB13444 TaxID=1314778 RepID=A0A5C3NZT7_9APHY|nr:hypothetical protein K466DRAFT_666604 [Polyporus arcularius HHB13444]
MSGPAATLTISPALALPNATPSLMPFHIAYSGPAPISTYFRIKPAPSPTFGREQPPSEPLLSPESQQTSDSQATLVGSSSSVSTVGSVAAVGVDVAVDVDVTTSEGDATVASADSRHYVAAFRGREMHGVMVDLPDGYAGIVLRAPDDKKGKGVASNRPTEEEKPVSKGRSTRRSKRAQEAVKVEDEEMDVGDMPGTASEEGPTRVLEPVSTFSSFLLWHPDIPVNDGRDEYVRSLKEWTRLAAEIHRVEDC